MKSQATRLWNLTLEGLKNYGYLTRGGKVECKVRGFSLNYKTKQRLNYYTLRERIR